jgi:hypothetical protein
MVVETDITKLTIAFRNSANAPKQRSYCADTNKTVCINEISQR